MKATDKATDIVELPPIDCNQRYTINEAAIYLRQSISKTYEDAKKGTLGTFRDGRRRYVPGTALLARSKPS
ncbi:MAG: helix-turn-helix domain-containing protein [Gammaproteobacteria bacterium]|nr:helix-turn-helix domain-containing protein [Gammaproteobacteria bacterium]